MTVKMPDGDRTPSRRCEECGSFVTREFARVFGNNRNEVHGCLECMSGTAVKRGAARAADADPRQNLLAGRTNR